MSWRSIALSSVYHYQILGAQGDPNKEADLAPGDDKSALAWRQWRQIKDWHDAR